MGSVDAMRLSALEPCDAAGIAALWLAGAAESAMRDRSFAPRQSEEEAATAITAALRDGSYYGWGLFLDEPHELVAYLTVRVEGPSEDFDRPSFLYLLDLDVHHRARRQGLGTRLVEAAKNDARTKGIDTVEVGWLLADPVAAAFWSRQGFGQYLARARLAIAPRE
jgi:GNAT superfamily N-acetyltransferase